MLDYQVLLSMVLNGPRVFPLRWARVKNVFASFLSRGEFCLGGRFREATPCFSSGGNTRLLYRSSIRTYVRTYVYNVWFVAYSIRAASHGLAICEFRSDVSRTFCVSFLGFFPCPTKIRERGETTRAPSSSAIDLNLGTRSRSRREKTIVITHRRCQPTIAGPVNVRQTAISCSCRKENKRGWRRKWGNLR